MLKEVRFCSVFPQDSLIVVENYTSSPLLQAKIKKQCSHLLENNMKT